MSVLLIIIHVFVCVALIMIVLLQTGKGADIGAAFGGGSSQTLFGSSGASTFLSKATTVAAIVFMLTSLTLAYRSSHRSGQSIMNEVQTPAAPPIEQPAESKDNPVMPENAPASASNQQPEQPDQPQ